MKLGTVFIYDDVSRPAQVGQSESRRLKYGHGPNPIILVPQPSDDPNDPLVRKLDSCNIADADGSRIGRYGSETWYLGQSPVMLKSSYFTRSS